jgi:hypothetical protein
MIHSELRTLTRALLAYDLDAYDIDFQSSDAKVTAVLNWALRSISIRLNLYAPSVVFTPVNGSASYPLRGTAFARRLLEVHQVIVNGEPLRDYTGRLVPMGFFEFQTHYPLWRSQTSGKPLATAVDGDTLVFDKPFNSATISAGSNFISGRILAPDLVSAGDIPEIPIEAHESIAYLAAVKAATPNATEQEGWTRLEAFSKAQSELINELAQRQQITIGGN